MNNLVKNIDFRVASENAAAGTSTAGTAGTYADMAGYNGVCFVVKIGTVTATGVPSVWAQGSTSTGSTSPVTYAGTAVTGTASRSNDMLLLDIYKPTHRYVRPVIARRTANVELDCALSLLYEPRTGPVSLSTTYVDQNELHVSPSSGTA